MELQKSHYVQLLNDIKEEIRRSQLEASRKVNKELIKLYWYIGKAIVERQEQHGWGKSVVENLSNDLRSDFPGIQGYSTHNLWRMRKFYLAYTENVKLAPLVQEIGWSHNIVVLEKCQNDLEREFYIQMTRKYGWTKNILIHQIDGNSYERFQLSQTNFDNALEDKYRDQAVLAVKDSYHFDFLELSSEYSEREMELALIKNVRKFLLEMGGDFTFIGNQYPLEVGGDEFSIDLLLYHRRLRALIAIDLKIKRFKPADVGQLQFYLTALDEKIKLDNEEPSIGIIICKDKNRTVVEYALRMTNNPMGVATYRMSNELPPGMQAYLPTPDQLIERLEAFSKEAFAEEE